MCKISYNRMNTEEMEFRLLFYSDFTGYEVKKIKTNDGYTYIANFTFSKHDTSYVSELVVGYTKDNKSYMVDVDSLIEFCKNPMFD